jgi:succinyl-diaminopimelate desuccinylase
MSIVGRLEGKKGKRLILNGHLDVVPPGDPKAWKFDPFGGVVEDGKIWGRGSADMKTKIASAMFVTRILKEKTVEIPGSVVLMFTADEETGGEFGTKYLVDEGVVRGEACVIGESAGRDIGVADKGNIHLKVVAHGKTAHGARPFEGENAIEKLLKLIPLILRLEHQDLPLPGAYLDIVEKALPYYEHRARRLNLPLEHYRRALTHATFCCSIIRGGVKRNVVPDAAEAEFDVRFPPGISAASVKELLNGLKGASDIAGWEAEVLEENEATFQDLDCEIYRAAERALPMAGGNKKPLALVKTSITDARHTRGAGIPTIILGHDGSGGHVPNEYSEIEEVMFTTRAYLHTILEYFNVDGRNENR